MQLKKRARRLAPTYDKTDCPNGTRRQPSDFNQIANLHPTNNRGAQPPRQFLTPRESFAINCARECPTFDGRPFGPMHLRGLAPSLKSLGLGVTPGRNW